MRLGCEDPRWSRLTHFPWIEPASAGSACEQRI